MKKFVLTLLLWSLCWVMMYIVGTALYDGFNYWSHVLSGIYAVFASNLIKDLTDIKERL